MFASTGIDISKLMIPSVADKIDRRQGVAQGPSVENKRLDEMSPSVADNVERRQSLTQGMGVEDISLSAQDEMSPSVADELDGGQRVNPSVAQEEWEKMRKSVEISCIQCEREEIHECEDDKPNIRNSGSRQMRDEMSPSVETEEDVPPENFSDIIRAKPFTRRKKSLLKKQIGELKVKLNSMLPSIVEETQEEMQRVARLSVEQVKVAVLNKRVEKCKKEIQSVEGLSDKMDEYGEVLGVKTSQEEIQGVAELSMANLKVDQTGKAMMEQKKKTMNKYQECEEKLGKEGEEIHSVAGLSKDLEIMGQTMEIRDEHGEELTEMEMNMIELELTESYIECQKRIIYLMENQETALETSDGGDCANRAQR